jgi:hypothetical protein
MAELTTKPTNSYRAEEDPLASLHKMSMTAGLGSQDYVAINNIAIGAVVLGLLGILALVWPLVLISSGAGLVCAIFAWLQIRNSNGTQTGRMIVLLAVVLCVGVGGFVAYRTAGAAIEASRDQQEIGQLIQKFGSHIANHEYDQAYVMCSDDFRQRVSEGQFADKLQTQDRLGGWGVLRSMAWNGVDDWFGTEANGNRIAVANTLVSYEKTAQPFQWNLSFLQVYDNSGAHWEINGIPSLFPKPGKSTGGPSMPRPGEAAPEGPGVAQ